jgi:imidazolonepropionase-like amidohydrolase
MKKYICLFASLLVGGNLAFGQANILPAKAQSKPITITNATLHLGNGQVINKGYISFANGKITAIAEGAAPVNAQAELIDATGKHVYPGFIAPVNNIGLTEIAAGAKSTDDATEIGEVNPHIRSIIAYNTDSKVIPTVRSNGILMSQPTPEGGLVTGQSSVVVLDGWNWEDAAYKKDIAIHMNWPAINSFGGFGGFGAASGTDQKEANQKVLANLDKYFMEAQAYAQLSKPAEVNARFEAMKGLFNGSKKLFVNVDDSRGIVQAVNFGKKFGIKIVIVGGEEAVQVSQLLRDNQVPVILIETQTLPGKTEDDVYLPYKRPKLLHDAGVLVGLTGVGYWRQRNLPFEAGTAAAYGLGKEQAVALISLNNAKILGIDQTTGSLETGKDATLFISGGDALDMLGNKVETAFIRGKNINLDNLHKQLYERYKEKYQLKN